MLRGGEPPLLGTGVGKVLGPLCGLVCCRLCVGVISRCSGRPSRSVIVGSTPFEDVERNAFLDEDLMVTKASLAAGRGFSADSIDGELIADALEDKY